MKQSLFVFSMMITIFFIGCSNKEGEIKDSLASISIETYIEEIRTLASDEFLGREPSTLGEKITLDYLKEKFQKLGLKPGNNGSWFQEVPLAAVETEITSPILIKGNKNRIRLKQKEDFVATTRRIVEKIQINESELVFAGYGVVAPEYDWNDYKNLDVKNKTVVVLVNDPGFGTKDTSLFNGNSMTYYGRWTYKYEEAARQGAEGVIIVHQTDAAGYPWEVVRNGWTGAQYYLQSDDKNISRCKFEGWITTGRAKEIFKAAGYDFEETKLKASTKDFESFSLRLNISLNLKNTISFSKSKNFLALLPGSDRKNEYIIYTAHWDHFGIDSSITEGDNIYNGARDNATGTAALIELARAFTKLSSPPSRSILFMAVTAEEQGLLGSKFYAENPVYPLDKTVAVLNMDALNIFGETKDIVIVGYGYSELDNYVEKAAEEQGRYVVPDPEPEKGYFFRSDHFSFAKKGVPSLYTDPGVDNLKHGKEWMIKKSDEWIENDYHKLSDEFDSTSWDLAGAIKDIKLLFRVGYTLSTSENFPNWVEGNEFRAIRDSMMMR